MTSLRKIKKAVIPAAGLGTRFLPATKAIPKEMLPILDKPTLQYIIDEAYEAGIEDVLIIIGRGKESIVNHFDRSVELEYQLAKSGKLDILEEVRGISEKVNIYYVRQKEAKGLGHAIACAEAFVGDDDFAILLGDDVIISDQKTMIGRMIEKYEEYGSSVLGLMDVEDKDVSKYGIIKGQEISEDFYKISDMIEKPSLDEAPSRQAIIGRYVVSNKIFDELRSTKPGKNNEIQLTDALLSLAQKEAMYGLKLSGIRYDIGSKSGFVKANLEFGLRDKDIKESLKAYIKDLDLSDF